MVGLLLPAVQSIPETVLMVGNTNSGFSDAFNEKTTNTSSMASSKQSSRIEYRGEWLVGNVP